jgi:hypothetical protein
MRQEAVVVGYSVHFPNDRALDVYDPHVNSLRLFVDACCREWVSKVANQVIGDCNNHLPRKKHWIKGYKDVFTRSPWLRHDLREISRVKTMIGHSRSLVEFVLSTG